MNTAGRSRLTGPGRGFTLIELLVVVVIVGIVSAVVLLSFGLLGDDRALTQQARRISSLIDLAADEALMQGREYGLEFMQSGYRFLEHDPLRDQWNEIAGDDLLRPRQLDEGMEFELFLEDRRVELEEKAAVTEKDEQTSKGNLTEDYLPHVLILSSGDLTPFNLRIVRQADGADVRIVMDVMGTIEIKTDAESAP